jgi:hypothetical protein
MPSQGRAEGDGRGLGHIRGQRTHQVATPAIGEAVDGEAGTGGKEASGPDSHVATAPPPSGVGNRAPARGNRVVAAPPPHEGGHGECGKRLAPTAHTSDLSVASGRELAKA